MIPPTAPAPTIPPKVASPDIMPVPDNPVMPIPPTTALILANPSHAPLSAPSELETFSFCVLLSFA